MKSSLTKINAQDAQGKTALHEAARCTPPLPFVLNPLRFVLTLCVRAVMGHWRR
jgi:hypothetical protein